MFGKSGHRVGAAATGSRTVMIVSHPNRAQAQPIKNVEQVQIAQQWIDTLKGNKHPLAAPGDEFSQLSA